MASNALRTLAFAYKYINEGDGEFLNRINFTFF